jgi:hypothetical protein
MDFDKCSSPNFSLFSVNVDEQGRYLFRLLNSNLLRQLAILQQLGLENELSLEQFDWLWCDDNLWLLGLLPPGTSSPPCDFEFVLLDDVFRPVIEEALLNVLFHCWLEHQLFRLGVSPQIVSFRLVVFEAVSQRFIFLVFVFFILFHLFLELILHLVEAHNIGSPVPLWRNWPTLHIGHATL